MNIIEIINKKRLGLELTKEEINYFVNEYVLGNIKDYQISSLLMAICINGMNDREIVDLTNVMLNSGDRIDLSMIDGIKVDKHSTGGVGDKTSLILLPIVASCGVKVAKMSGRGLGFTGGTIDKLDSIPGFKTNITNEEFLNQVKNIGVAIVSQTGNLVPADKKLYALRDVTGTVESIPLIASSIMSKKLASGADKIVIDLKVGSGALVKDLENARKLANILVKIGKENNKETICVLTNMDQPLGNAIGNALEVQESIDVLNNNGPKDITELVIVLGSYMVSMGLNISYEEAKFKVLDSLNTKKAYNKFLEMVKLQGGNIEGLTISDKVISIKSKETGFIKHIDTSKLGEIIRKLGGGRYNKEDSINYKVGIVLKVKQGDYILEDEEILKVYMEDKDVSIDEILECFDIDNSSGDNLPLIYEIVK
ncbi:MAG TPA: thymidine phosphorylase [Bacilli bacterium]|nr:thymidine phosphorylase [Bacilli bacterium]